jgi:hypothetical protein
MSRELRVTTTGSFSATEVTDVVAVCVSEQSRRSSASSLSRAMRSDAACWSNAHLDDVRDCGLGGGRQSVAEGDNQKLLLNLRDELAGLDICLIRIR